jgi:putative RecB family exonuclease
LKNSEHGAQKERISYSHISAFEKCPLMYSYRYIERLPTRPSKHLSFGNSIHAAIEEFQRAYLKKAGDLSIDDTRDFIEELLNKHWKDEGYESQEEMKRWKIKAVEALHNSFLPWFFTQLDDSYETVAIEDWFEVDFEICSLIGKIDRVDLRRENTNIYYRVIDFKTGESIPQKNSQSEDLQLYVYTYGAESLLKEKLRKELFDEGSLKIEKIMFFYVVPGKEVENTLEEAHRTFAKQKIASQAVEIINARRAGLFPPKTGNHCRWCDYNDICNAFKNGSIFNANQKSVEDELNELVGELVKKLDEARELEKRIAELMKKSGINEYRYGEKTIRLKNIS